jgi:hypothetical protein
MYVCDNVHLEFPNMRFMPAYIHTQTYKYKCIQTYIYIYIYIHRYTYIHTYLGKLTQTVTKLPSIVRSKIIVHFSWFHTDGEFLVLKKPARICDLLCAYMSVSVYIHTSSRSQGKYAMCYVFRDSVCVSIYRCTYILVFLFLVGFKATFFFKLVSLKQAHDSYAHCWVLRNTYIHTYIHTHVHTYFHTNTHTYLIALR